MTNLPTKDALAVAAVIDPVLVDNDTAATGWVDMATGRKLMFVLAVGATDTTVAAKLQAAADGEGTSPADITGKAITALTGTDDDSQVILEIDSRDMPAGKSHVRLHVTVGDGTTGANIAAVGLLHRLRYAPARHIDSVVEVV